MISLKYIPFILEMLLLSVNGISDRPDANALIITSSNVGVMSMDSLYIEVEYSNNSEDTLILCNYLTYRNLQEIVFVNSASKEDKPCCGKIADFTFSSSIGEKCSYEEEAKYDHYFTILPYQKVSKVYNLTEDLGYFGFEINKKYEYQVRLNISKKFKSYCSNVWLGTTYSNIGVFEVK